ncbi:hypothetical protein N0V93_006344 [Gnomoniopsis smithogilvyi]|uniref:Uncharacterized protein n=1 Tax=Gnomoniopsis smithogilvyi TaxID=1191159 RepID=A0A9W8YN23_9PEZI|nr:hypothetical protein N0V93_006344 [Gnomoniopsis smithogilvyi]
MTPPKGKWHLLVIPISPLDAGATTAVDDPLEKAEATKESGAAAPEGLKGEEALDAAIGDSGEGEVDPEITSGVDDALEKAEAKKESSA